jgi:hypothetical protein
MSNNRPYRNVNIRLVIREMLSLIDGLKSDSPITYRTFQNNAYCNKIFNI